MQRRHLIEPLEARQLLTTYYVDTAGNNANSGTSTSSPWQTVGQIALKSFKGGDQILFKGGQTFYGKLYLSTDDKGTSTSAIKISSFGSGRATIHGGNDSAIFINNTAGVDIININCAGNGSSVNRSGGIYAYNSMGGGVKLNRIHIGEVDVKGFKNGIVIGGGNGSSGFKNVWIYSSSVHDNAHAGIFTFAATKSVHEDVYVGHVQVYNNVGISSDSGVTGHGILLGAVRRGTIERSVAHDNGSRGNGGAGMWAYDSTEVLFQYNESYNNKTSGPHDGDGFDFDQNMTNSMMQYNYSHGNDGAGFLMATKMSSGHSGNVIRYNISQNDCRKLDYGALHIWGKVTKAEWYNNTVYLIPKSGSTAPRYAIKIINDYVTANDVANVHFRNNIIVATGGVTLLWITSDQLNGASDLKFQGNAWHNGSGFKIKWGNTTYSNLSAFRSATGQEKNGATAVGYQGDPKLSGMGTGGTIGNADRLNTLSAYKLLTGSPLRNTALTLSSFGVSAGSRDFWGTALPQGGKYDVGADEA